MHGKCCLWSDCGRPVKLTADIHLTTLCSCGAISPIPPPPHPRLYGFYSRAVAIFLTFTRKGITLNLLVLWCSESILAQLWLYALYDYWALKRGNSFRRFNLKPTHLPNPHLHPFLCDLCYVMIPGCAWSSAVTTQPCPWLLQATRFLAANRSTWKNQFETFTFLYLYL